MKKNGLLIIISGPSGAGKGSVVSEIIKDSSFVLSISATTRKPRPNEIEGVNYFFKTQEQFQDMIKKNLLLEYAKFCDDFYGTPIDYVNENLNKGKNIILEIEVQGALQVKNIFKESILIFLIPPTIKHLENRLKNRSTETIEKINMRLKRAREEVKLTDKYDYIVINDILADASNQIKEIINVEKQKAFRNNNLITKFLKGEN